MAVTRRSKRRRTVSFLLAAPFFHGRKERT
nr:MAG TPA: hypothetical protein [Caudoviricetes sp.]